MPTKHSRYNLTTSIISHIFYVSWLLGQEVNAFPMSRTCNYHSHFAKFEYKTFLQRQKIKDHLCAYSHKPSLLSLRQNDNLDNSSDNIELNSATVDNTNTKKHVAAIQSLTFYDIDPIVTNQQTSNKNNNPPPDLLADFLMELGAFSTSITKDKDLNTNVDSEDLLTSKCNVNAYFTSSFHLPSIIDLVQSTLYNNEEEDDNGIMPQYKIETLSDTPTENLEQSQEGMHVKPVLCAGFLLKLPYHTDTNVQEILQEQQQFISQDQITSITLEGGIAFGSMAEHPTTQLCLSYLRDILDTIETSPRLMLDYGAGSGILGLAACKLGVGQAVGIEMDVDAIQIANANSQRNNCNMVTYLPSLDSIMKDDNDNDDTNNSKDDRESFSVSIIGSASRSSDLQVQGLPNELNGQIYDLCVANILPKALTTLGSVIAGMVKPGKEIALSGIRDHQANDIIQIYSAYFNDCKVDREKEGWVLIRGTRKHDNL